MPGDELPELDGVPEPVEPLVGCGEGVVVNVIGPRLGAGVPVAVSLGDLSGPESPTCPVEVNPFEIRVALAGIAESPDASKITVKNKDNLNLGAPNRRMFIRPNGMPTSPNLVVKLWETMRIIGYEP